MLTFLFSLQEVKLEHGTTDLKSSVPIDQQVTYTWDNINVSVNIQQGNLISRLCKKTPPIQKRILENGSEVSQMNGILS